MLQLLPRRNAQVHGLVLLAVVSLLPNAAIAQAVCLPAPRLLTTVPMGGQVGTQVDVVITGENIEDVQELRFSHPGITATQKLNADGTAVTNTYVVTITADCPLGIHEARLMSRLGVSSSRVFSVGALPEQLRTSPNTTLATAMTLPLNSICNASLTKQTVDFYKVEAKQNQRILVDCAAKGIDSKLNPVLIIADAQGNDLVVERRGGVLDFTVPADGTFVVKVHDLTFAGGANHFYRLSLTEVAKEFKIVRMPSTSTVSSFSWPPVNLPEVASSQELEPNDENSESQKITLPCDLAGSFFPAADVDTFEFSAVKGEIWWIEVASERLGKPTDPSLVVQQVTATGEAETLKDVVELTDIPSPVKVSSNGYSYDGPPYNAGSTDILGKLEIQEDGIHRLRLTDLFGGTRNDPNNIYRLIIRKAEPDFALVAWGLHMTLRNGDRNALSKPIALRGGATIPLEVVVARRDGFDGPIELQMSNLPDGVTATGLTIPAGQSRGIMLITADQNAPRGLTSANFTGLATLNDSPVTRPCRLASMAWPVSDAWSEIPSPRLSADVPVSVCDSEFAPVTIQPGGDQVWEVVEGEKLTIPLVLTRRCEFSGKKMSLKTFGPGFENAAEFDAPLDADNGEATLDLAALKTPPGDYKIAFYGTAVAKYQYNLPAVAAAEESLKLAQADLETLKKHGAELAEVLKSVTAELRSETESLIQKNGTEITAAEAKVQAADQRLKTSTTAALPKDIVDIVVSSPISIRVKPAEKK